MLPSARELKIEDYLAMAWRRKWWILIPFVVVSLAGVGLAYKLPRAYRANTLILVIPQRVPEDYVRPTVTSRIEDRLNTLSQQVMSRTRLQSVIDAFGLYRSYADKLTQEEIIDIMRSNIEIEVKGGGRRSDPNAFEIAFSGSSPWTVMMVTNRLASLFIEENLKVREQQAEGTAEFLADQLKKILAELERQEKRITSFKLKYMGELPEQTEANLRLLDQLQLQYQRLTDSLRSAEDRKVLIQKQLADLNNERESLAAGMRLSVAEETPSNDLQLSMDPDVARLERLNQQLIALKGRYTERHPEVIRTQREIEELRGIMPSRASTTLETQGSQKSLPLAKVLPPSYLAKFDYLKRTIRDLSKELTSTNLEIKRLREEESRLIEKVAEYRRRVEIAPKREQELTTLSRDYGNTRTLYQSLLMKKMEAEQAKTLEHRQKGEQFRILDPAELPQKPFKPNIKKIIIVAVMIGLGLGCGLAYLKEHMDRSFKDPEDLQAYTGFPVLAVIPNLQEETKRDKVAGKRKKVA